MAYTQQASVVFPFNANHPIMKHFVVYHVPMFLHHAKCAPMKIIATGTPLHLWFLLLLRELDNHLRIAAHSIWFL